MAHVMTPEPLLCTDEGRAMQLKPPNFLLDLKLRLLCHTNINQRVSFHAPNIYCKFYCVLQKMVFRAFCSFRNLTLSEKCKNPFLFFCFLLTFNDQIWEHWLWQISSEPLCVIHVDFKRLLNLLKLLNSHKLDLSVLIRYKNKLCRIISN